jgi:hypothetical protein
MCGNASVAFDLQALLSSARLLAVARSVIETAMAILTRKGPPTFRDSKRAIFASPSYDTLADIAA